MAVWTPKEMRVELARRLPNADDDDRVLFWLNEEQEFIESFRDDWTFCLASGSISAEDGVADYNLPVNFKRFLSVRNSTSKIAMYPQSITKLDQRDPARASAGSPRDYTRMGKVGTDDTTGEPCETVKLWPTADDDYTVPFDYYMALPKLTTDANTPSLVPMHSLLILGAEMRGRIDSEEDEDMRVLNHIIGRYTVLLDSLVASEAFGPDEDKGMKPHFSVSLPNFGASGVVE